MCRPSSLQHLCLHPPGSTFWSRSRLLPITHAQLITSCPFNLSVGQSCLHFISPLISNYPSQNPKSHNLGFHQHPLHNTKINQANWHLIHHHHTTKLFHLVNQNTMFIIDNTHFQIIHSFHHQKFIHTSFIIFSIPNNTITHTKSILPLISNHIILKQNTIKGNKLRLSSFSQLSVLFRK